MKLWVQIRFARCWIDTARAGRRFAARYERQIRNSAWLVAGSGLGQLVMAWLVAAELPAGTAGDLRTAGMMLAVLHAGLAAALFLVPRLPRPRLSGVPAVPYDHEALVKGSWPPVRPGRHPPPTPPARR